MASMQEQQQQHQQQQIQVQHQQQSQQQQPQHEQKKIIITSETIEIAKKKLRELGPGPFSPEDQKKHDYLKAFLAKAAQLFQNQQNQQQAMLQQQHQQQQLQHQQQQHASQPQIASAQAHVPQTIQNIPQAQPAVHPPQMPTTSHQLLQQPQPQPTPQPQPQPQAQPPPSTQQAQQQQQQQPQQQSNQQSQSSVNPQILDKRALQDLVKEVDPSEQLDEDVEELLLQVADDFIENVINNSCQLAKHRKSNILEAKDVQFHLERNYNIWIPGYATDELKIHKKALSTEAHKQRLMLIKKSTTGPGAGPGTSQSKDK